MNLKIFIMPIFPLLLFSCKTINDNNYSTDLDSTSNNIIENSIKTEYHIKEFPTTKNYSILPPDMNYRYFEKNKIFPFEPHNKDFSLVNSWWLSDSAFLSYAHPGFARMAFELAGLPNFRFFEIDGTEAMVAWNNDYIIVSFRGTELKSKSTLIDIITDLRIIPVEYNKGGRVHKGFLTAFNRVWFKPNGLKKLLDNLNAEDKSREIWITGHSLGGALATLCFATMENATGLYIFGAPRVGDQDFTTLLKDRPVFRIENNKDPIPKLPPIIPGFSLDNAGQTIFLNELGGMSKQRDDPMPTEDLTPLKESLSSIKDDLDFELLDHMPINYSIKLWNILIKE